LEIDQILSAQIKDEECQTFMLKHVADKNVTLSSINFYLKNAKKDHRDEIKSLVMNKIEAISHDNFWSNVEDIFEYFENELSGEEKISNMKMLLDKMLELPYKEITQS